MAKIIDLGHIRALLFRRTNFSTAASYSQMSRFVFCTPLYLLYLCVIRFDLYVVFSRIRIYSLEWGYKLQPEVQKSNVPSMGIIS